MYISLNISLSRLQYKNNAFLPLREIVQVYNTYITGDRCHKSTVFLKSGLSEKTSTAVLIRIASELRCFFGGEGGIRTHVPRRATAFRVRLVMTTSILLQIFKCIFNRRTARAAAEQNLPIYYITIPHPGQPEFQITISIPVGLQYMCYS